MDAPRQDRSNPRRTISLPELGDNAKIRDCARSFRKGQDHGWPQNFETLMALTEGNDKKRTCLLEDVKLILSSTMTGRMVDANASDRIRELGQRVIKGGSVSRDEGRWLFELRDSADIFDLMSWANRIREHYKGNKVHLCSIVNVEGGRLFRELQILFRNPASYQTEAPRYGLVDLPPVLTAAEEAHTNGVTALGLVAAWRGLEEGPVLDQICDRLEELRDSGKTRPDASLGIIKNPRVAQRLKESGLECYNHNLESSERFFPQV